MKVGKTRTFSSYKEYKRRQLKLSEKTKTINSA